MSNRVAKCHSILGSRKRRQVPPLKSGNSVQYVVDVIRTWTAFYLYFWFILVGTCAKSLGHRSFLFQSFPLDTFPFHPTVLKPDFNLSFRQVQTYSNFVSSEPGQVIIPLKFVFQLLYLMLGESCSFFSLLSGGFSGFCSCKIKKNTIWNLPSRHARYKNTVYCLIFFSDNRKR